MAKNDVTVKILGDARGFKSATDEANGALGRLGRVVGVAGLAIGAGFVAAGVGLAKLGEKFDSAYDDIQIQTGATGDALEGLTDSFDTVLASGPSSFEDVSAAIGGLNQRLGLTGEPLEALSGQFLDLSRITGTDVATNVESLTRLFGDWGISAEDQAGSLDELFRASQATGVGVDELARGMTQFGGPMRQLGFSFEETAALMGGFEAQGVNTELVMGSMRIALGKFAKAGEDAPEALARITGEIAGMDEAAGNARAIEIFGARAGPDMAAAIREGRFEIGDYLDIIENGESTIAGTAAATDDWREKLATLKNKVLVKLAPLAEKVFGAITDGLAAAMPYLESFGEWVGTKGQQAIDWFKKAWPGIKDAIASVADYIQNVAWPVIRDVFTNIAAALSTAFSWLMDNKEFVIGALAAITVGLVAWGVAATAAALASAAAALPFIAIGLAIAGVVGGLIYAYNHFETFRNIVDGVVDWFVNTAWPLMQTVFNGIKAAAQSVVNWFQANWDNIADIAEDVWGRLSNIVGGIVGFFDGIVSGIQEKGWLGFLVGAGSDLLNGLWQGIQSVWDGTVKPWLTSLPGLAFSAIGSLFTTLAGRGKDLLAGLLNGAVGVWNSNIAPWLASVSVKAFSAIGSLFTTLASRGKDLLAGLLNGAVGLWNSNIAPWLASVSVKAFTAVGSLFTTLASRGKDLLAGLLNGAIGLWNSNIAPWLTSVSVKAFTAVGSLFTTLASRGKDLLAGLLNGAVSNWNGSLAPWLGSLSVKAFTAVGSLFTTLASRGKDLLAGLLNGAVSNWNGSLAPWLGSLSVKAFSAVGSLFSTLASRGKDLLAGLLNGAIGVWNGSLSGWLGGLDSKIVSAVGSLGSILYGAGKSVLGGLLDGMKAAWGGAASWLGGIGGKIVNLKGPPAKDAKLLVKNGELIMEGLQKGLREGWGDTTRLLGGMTASVPAIQSGGWLSGRSGRQTSPLLDPVDPVAGTRGAPQTRGAAVTMNNYNLTQTPGDLAQVIAMARLS